VVRWEEGRCVCVFTGGGQCIPPAAAPCCCLVCWLSLCLQAACHTRTHTHTPWQPRQTPTCHTCPLVMLSVSPATPTVFLSLSTQTAAVVGRVGGQGRPPPVTPALPDHAVLLPLNRVCTAVDYHCRSCGWRSGRSRQTPTCHTCPLVTMLSLPPPPPPSPVCLCHCQHKPQLWLAEWAAKADPPERYVWTSHPWLLSLYLDCPSHIGVACPSVEQQQAVRAAMRAGV
jgi:hypothetical protein